jgi:hypothetical protein
VRHNDSPSVGDVLHHAVAILPSSLTRASLPRYGTAVMTPHCLQLQGIRAAMLSTCTHTTAPSTSSVRKHLCVPGTRAPLGGCSHQ